MTETFLSLLPILLVAVLAVVALWFLAERGLTLMMFFQQEEYDGPRFIQWMRDNKAYDRVTSWYLVAALIFGSLMQTSILVPAGETIEKVGLLTPLLIFIAFLLGSLRSRALRRGTKKPLVITARVKRIFMAYLALAGGAILLLILLASLAPKGTHYGFRVDQVDFDLFGAFLAVDYDWQLNAAALMALALVQAPPLLLVFANKLLEPAEERVKAGFRKEALEKFEKLAPKVIAITGSFGKTSTKHILSHILSAAAPTLATPGSVNTDMGITRVIREQLEPDHQYFIVEMGAYGPGSIARLCALTPPDVALVTAVGAAHYERFGSLETVARAKFEIAEAAFKRGGRVVVAKDGIDPKLLEGRLKAVPGDYTLVGDGGDIALTGFKPTKEGLEISLSENGETQGETQTLQVPLYGRHQVGNVALAAATARALGLPWAAIKGALATVPQIRHRLEVTRTADAPTIINDAYNSNPVGFAAALETLDVLVEDGGRRILITPGMVELGAKHEQEHAALGALAAKHCDIVVIVTPERIPSFVKALEGANDGSVTVMSFARQDLAEEWVRNNWRAGDAVLFENNLPDLYEATVRF